MSGNAAGRLAGQTAFYTAASLLPALARFLVLPLLTRHLSPEAFAVVALAVTFSSVAGIVMTLQVQSGIQRFFAGYLARGQEREARGYLGTMYALAAVMLVGGGLLLEGLGDLLVALTFPKSGLAYAPYFRLAVLLVCMSTLQGVAGSVLRSLERAGTMLALSAVETALAAAVKIWCVVGMGWDARGVLWGDLVGAGAAALLGLVVIRRWLGWSPRLRDIRSSLRYSTPLVPHALAQFLFNLSDRILLEKFVALGALGLYSVADQFARIPMLVVNAFAAANWAQFVALAEVEPEAAARRNEAVIGLWWIGMCAMMVGAVLGMGPLLRSVTAGRFHAASGLATVLCLGALFHGLYCFACDALFVRNKTHVIATITLSAGVANVGLNLLLLPRWGVLAAAWTTVAAHALSFVFAYRAARRAFVVRFPWRRMAAAAALALAFAAAAEAASWALDLGDVGRLAFAGLAVSAFVPCGLWLQGSSVEELGAMSLRAMG